MTPKRITVIAVALCLCAGLSLAIIHRAEQKSTPIPATFDSTTARQEAGKERTHPGAPSEGEASGHQPSSAEDLTNGGNLAVTSGPDSAEHASGPPVVIGPEEMERLTRNDPYLRSVLGEHTSLNELEPDQLIMMIKSPEASDTVRHQAIQALIAWGHRPDIDRGKAYESLAQVKDAVMDEDQQYLLKEMRNFPEFGGNEAIVDSFVRAGEAGETILNRTRMLSYLDPSVPLSQEKVQQLQTLYPSVQDQDVKTVLVGTIAQMGGGDGVSWLVDRVAKSTDYGEWSLIVDSLGRSNSQMALDYLHQALNAAVPLGPQYEENRERLRKAILRMAEPPENTASKANL